MSKFKPITEVQRRRTAEALEKLEAGYQQTQGFLASDFHQHFLAEKEKRDNEIRAQLGGDKKLTQEELEDKLADLF